MEDSRFRPDKEDNELQDAAPKKKRSGDFLSQYLLRRREVETDSQEENDKETDEKPKKWRRFFKGIFRQVVQPPEAPKKSSEHNFDPNAWFAWELSHNDPKAATSQSSERQEEPPQTTSLTDAKTPQEISDEVLSKEQLETPEKAVAESPIMEQPERPLISSSESVVENRGSTTQPNVEKEVVIERGVGAGLPLLLVGAEYFARKRADRKVEKRLGSEISNLKKEASRSDFAREELDSIVRQNREQLESLKRERGIHQERFKRPAEPEAENRPAQHTRFERKNDTEKIVEQPSVIFERVAEAAEHDEPVERVFERSHEIKDNHSAPASSVGAIMAAQSAASTKIQIPDNQTSSNIGNGSLPSIPVKELMKDESYQQAVKTGFWAAISIIIFGMLAYLMIK